MVAWAAMAVAQETNRAPAPTSSRTGPMQDDRYYDTLRRWNAHEIRSRADIECLAHTVFAPAEDKQYRAIAATVGKTPEVQAANKAHSEMKNTMMVKINPACSELNRRLTAKVAHDIKPEHVPTVQACSATAAVRVPEVGGMGSLHLHPRPRQTDSREIGRAHV